MVQEENQVKRGVPQISLSWPVLIIWIIATAVLAGVGGYIVGLKASTELPQQNKPKSTTISLSPTPYWKKGYVLWSPPPKERWSYPPDDPGFSVKLPDGWSKGGGYIRFEFEAPKHFMYPNEWIINYQQASSGAGFHCNYPFTVSGNIEDESNKIVQFLREHDMEILKNSQRNINGQQFDQIIVQLPTVSPLPIKIGAKQHRLLFLVAVKNGKAHICSYDPGVDDYNLDYPEINKIIDSLVIY